METIFIKQLKVETIIGVYDFERTNKQAIYLDIELQYDASQAMASDSLAYALDYHKISIDIHDYIATTSFNLIEALADRVCAKLLTNKLVENVSLVVHKPQAVSQAQSIGFGMVRKKTS